VTIGLSGNRGWKSACREHETLR